MIAASPPPEKKVRVCYIFYLDTLSFFIIVNALAQYYLNREMLI